MKEPGSSGSLEPHNFDNWAGKKEPGSSDS